MYYVIFHFHGRKVAGPFLTQNEADLAAENLPNVQKICLTDEMNNDKMFIL